MGVGEARLRGRDQEVAGERDLEAAGHRDAVDRADHGLPERPEQLRRVGDRPALAVRIAHLLQIEAGTEGAAGAGEDDHANFFVVVEVKGGPGEKVAQLLGEGVQHARAVQREGGDALGLFDQQNRLRHGSNSPLPRFVGEASYGSPTIPRLRLGILAQPILSRSLRRRVSRVSFRGAGSWSGVTSCGSE